MDVSRSNSLFIYDTVTIVPLSATSKDLGVGLDLQIINPVTFRSPEGALFLRNYLLETAGTIALDTRGVRFRYFMSALSALNSPVLVLTVVLSCLQQAV